MNNNNKVSVIIPAYNEEEHICKVIDSANRSDEVDEVIVIDDGSEDNTNKIAVEAGAKVYKSDKNVGKGEAMNVGVQKSEGDIIVFLDADLKNITPEKINKLIYPAANGHDFAKAAFHRSAGRITELTAKPLLNIFFPEINFQQPLSGQIAMKRELAKKMQFEHGFKVDIALLIDAIMRGSKVKEVHIGEIQHDKRDLKKLKGMADIIAQTIIERAKKYGRVDIK